MTYWPAIDLARVPDADLALAAIDDFSPSAVEDRPPDLRVFFSTADARDAALTSLVASGLSATPIDVDDEDWARRSQENLTAVTVGRIVVTPPIPSPQSPVPSPQPPVPSPQPPTSNLHPRVTVTIQPSMGFGTGHHATTRLCLAALQIDLVGKSVLDVGTGSGVLAIAAVLLGADHSTGVDMDADAVQSARENLTLNPAAVGVDFAIADFRSAALSPVDVVVANLTGALLARSAPRLTELVAPGGSLIVSGLLAHERVEVVNAFAALRLDGEGEEDGWAALVFRRPEKKT